ncbi:MAG: TIGR04255 family protein [Actinobacteria bacterium]|nr:TIGR04255 family protein [Actinomycetota bacterium]
MPTFENPPVVEQVLAVRFAPLDAFTSPYLGSFWSRVESDFPIAFERGPYDMPLERLGDALPRGGIEFTVGPPPAKTRAWLVSADDERLIQIQRDFFAYNWRKRKGDYDRYEVGRDNFAKYFREFEAFLADKGLGEIGPRQCEVTYINHIRPGPPSKLSSLVSVLQEPELRQPATALLTANLALVLALEKDGARFANLHVSAVPATQGDDDESIWVLTLTARGLPLGEGIGGILAFLDLSRRAIVTNFVTLTTEECHKEWGLTWP